MKLKVLDVVCGNKTLKFDKVGLKLFFKYNWFINNYGYLYRKNTKGIFRAFHQDLLDISPPLTVDHINRNTLDNRLENLRVANFSLQMHNRGKIKQGSSKFRGVHRSNRTNSYIAQIGKDGIKYYLGCFKTEYEAAKAYDKKCKELYGSCGLINFPDNPSGSDQG